MKILALVPRRDLHRRIETALRSAHFVLDSTSLAQDCLTHYQMCPYSGVILDSVSLGFMQTTKLIRRLREERPGSAIFVFERYLELEQRLNLFEAGADDCVSEPFFASEFVVRLGLLIRLRQAASSRVNILRAGELELDLVRRKATRLRRVIDLRPKEFLLLEYLVRNANRPVTRTMIIEHVWNSSFEGLTNVVDVYISGLRSKVDRDFPQKLIQTSRGVGYTLTCPEGVATQAGEIPSNDFVRSDAMVLAG